MIHKRLEQGAFAWPRVGDGVMRLSRVQFEGPMLCRSRLAPHPCAAPLDPGCDRMNRIAL